MKQSSKIMKTPEEFIEFFEAIPDEKWRKSSLGQYTEDRCALGHLGVNSYVEINNDQKVVQNVKNLGGLLWSNGLLVDNGATENFGVATNVVWRVNDAETGKSPKSNILNALRNKTKNKKTKK